MGAAPSRVHGVELLPALPQVGAAVAVVVVVVLQQPAPGGRAVLVHGAGRAVAGRLRAAMLVSGSGLGDLT